MYLLDTNVFSELLREQPDPGVLKSYRAKHANICCAAMVWHELVYGGARMPVGRKRDAVMRFIDSLRSGGLRIVEFDMHAAEWLAHERTRLERMGRPVPMIDGQIAACAAVNDCTLITRNVKDFLQFKGLRVETWFA